MTTVKQGTALAALQAQGKLTGEMVYEIHRAALATPQDADPDVDTAELEAVTCKLGKAVAQWTASVERDNEITEMGREFRRPKLAKRLIKEGVSMTEAFKRFIHADEAAKVKKARAADIHAARIAEAIGGEGARSGVPAEPVAVKPTPKGKDHGWSKAAAGVKADKQIGHGWDRVIAEMKGHG